MKYFSLIYGRCSRVESNRKTHFFSSFPSTPYNVQRTTYNIQHNGQGNPSSPFNVASNLPSQQKSASSNQMVEMAIHLETCYLGFRPIGGKIPPGHRYPQMLHVWKKKKIERERKGISSWKQTNCFLSAFSTVIADNQFSTLGIVLLAALARLSKITGISHQLKMQPVSEPKIIPVAKEDLGERIRRIDTVPLAPVKISQSDSKASKVSMVSKAAKEKPTEKPKDVSKPTKKKKKKNAIDDLFSGLFWISYPLLCTVFVWFLVLCVCVCFTGCKGCSQICISKLKIVYE